MQCLKSKFVHTLGSSLVMLFDPRNGQIETYDVDGELREVLRVGDPGYGDAKANAFPLCQVGETLTTQDKLAMDCAHKRVPIAMVIRMAKYLLSEDGENSEYDRAITELVIDICGLSHEEFDGTLQAIRNFDNKEKRFHAGT